MVSGLRRVAILSYTMSVKGRVDLPSQRTGDQFVNSSAVSATSRHVSPLTFVIRSNMSVPAYFLATSRQLVAESDRFSIQALYPHFPRLCLLTIFPLATGGTPIPFPPLPPPPPPAPPLLPLLLLPERS